jgi:hypothetical protein
VKAFKPAVLAVALVLGASVASEAFAHGKFRHHPPRARVSVFIGAPVVLAPWYIHPYYYHPPRYYYYYPPAVVLPSPPPVYIERGDAQPAPPPQGYWYYCPESRAYYPYVDRCSGGWQRVLPQPPPS